MPGSEDPEFRQASPLRKISAYKTDDGVGFSDSSIIVAYLERTSSNNALFPEKRQIMRKLYGLRNGATQRYRQLQMRYIFKKLLVLLFLTMKLI